MYFALENSKILKRIQIYISYDPTIRKRLLFPNHKTLLILIKCYFISWLSEKLLTQTKEKKNTEIQIRLVVNGTEYKVKASKSVQVVFDKY